MKYIVLGAGQAGFMTAKTIRDNDPQAQIRIFDADPAGLYAKMRLPEFVAGSLPEAKLILADEAAFRSMNIESFLGVGVTSVRRADHCVVTADGREFDYDKISKEIDRLIEASHQNKTFTTVKMMKQLVPEYISKNSIYEQLDPQ